MASVNRKSIRRFIEVIRSDNDLITIINKMDVTVFICVSFFT